MRCDDAASARLNLLFLYSGFVLAEVCKWNSFWTSVMLKALLLKSSAVSIVLKAFWVTGELTSAATADWQRLWGAWVLCIEPWPHFHLNSFILSPHRFFFLGKLSNALKQQSICQNLARRCTNDEWLLEKPWTQTWQIELNNGVKKKNWHVIFI